jgi:hypothetical protein
MEKAGNQDRILIVGRENKIGVPTKDICLVPM